ncbi:serine protease inhibitor precursor [Aphelenchoides avenae]|nr:serine protease inhibitor precursor [Aphelenchus avenae]
MCISPECVCVDGYVRSDNGTCTSAKECGSTTDLPCGDNEELKPCGACDGTCSNRSPMCTMECREAECGCIAGYVRDSEDGHCVAVEECAHLGSSCGENEEVKQCGACDGTCADLEPVCTLECRRPECGCKDGFVRNDEGTCVLKSSCK